MKKVFLLIALLCYLVAIAGCIAHIICEVIPTIEMAILFIFYVIMVLAMMVFSTILTIKTLKKIFSKLHPKLAFDGLSLNSSTDSEYEKEGGAPLADIFADDSADTSTTEEATEEDVDKENN